MSLDPARQAGGAPVVNSIGVAFSGVLAGTWLGWLPPAVALLASLLAVAWYAIQIWESATVKRIRRRAGWTVPADEGS
jgi:hypothetical protein